MKLATLLVPAALLLILPAEAQEVGAPRSPQGATLRVHPVPIPEARGYLGVSIADEREGVSVQRVEPGTPAERAGLRPGDRIVAVDGVELGDTNALVEAISARAPGASVRIEVLREGRTVELDATLAARERASGPRALDLGDAGGELERLIEEQEAAERDWRDELRARHEDLGQRTEERWRGWLERSGSGELRELDRRLADLRAERRRRFERFLDSMGELERERRSILDDLRHRVGERRRSGPGWSQVPPPLPGAESGREHFEHRDEAHGHPEHGRSGNPGPRSDGPSGRGREDRAPAGERGPEPRAEAPHASDPGFQRDELLRLRDELGSLRDELRELRQALVERPR